MKKLGGSTMTKRLPIKAAKDLAKDFDLTQVLLVAWDKKNNMTHVVTYGKTVEDCKQAAAGGNRLKKEILGWPPEHCDASPSRARKGGPLGVLLHPRSVSFLRTVLDFHLSEVFDDPTFMEVFQGNGKQWLEDANRLLKEIGINENVFEYGKALMRSDYEIQRLREVTGVT